MTAPDAPEQRLSAESVVPTWGSREALKLSRRATIRNAVVAALQPIYGDDNVSPFEDDPWRIGICFSDGTFMTLQIDGPVS